MSSINSWASMAPKHSSSPGAATEAGQSAPPLFEEGRHFAVAERPPDYHHDVERVGQLVENRTKPFTNQAPGAAALHAVANLP